MLHKLMFNAKDRIRTAEATAWCYNEFGQEETENYEGEWKVLQVGWNRDLVEFSFRNAEDAMAFKLTWV